MEEEEVLKREKAKKRESKRKEVREGLFFEPLPSMGGRRWMPQLTEINAYFFKFTRKSCLSSTHSNPLAAFIYTWRLLFGSWPQTFVPGPIFMRKACSSITPSPVAAKFELCGRKLCSFRIVLLCFMRKFPFFPPRNDIYTPMLLPLSPFNSLLWDIVPLFNYLNIVIYTILCDFENIV